MEYLDVGISPTGFAIGSSDSPSKWYQHLGHPSLQRLRFVLPATSTIARLDCESCEFCKYRRASYLTRVNKCSSFFY